MDWRGLDEDKHTPNSEAAQWTMLQGAAAEWPILPILKKKHDIKNKNKNKNLTAAECTQCLPNAHLLSDKQASASKFIPMTS